MLDWIMGRVVKSQEAKESGRYKAKEIGSIEILRCSLA